MERREQRRAGVARLVRLHEDDGAFDKSFWQTIPASQRLEALWDMTLDLRELKGNRGDQPRLQRSVCRVERHGG